MGAPVPPYAKVHRGRPFPCGRGGNGLYQEVTVVPIVRIQADCGFKAAV